MSTQAVSQKVTRIAVNAVSAKSGGAAVYAYNLSAELVALPAAAEKLEVTLFLPEQQVQKIRQRVGRSRLKLCSSDAGSSSPLNRFLWDQIALRRYLSRSGTDVLISSSDFGVFGSPSRQILMVRNGLFFSSYYRNEILPRKSLVYRLLFNLRRQLVLASIRSSDLVMTASEALMKEIRSCVPLPEAKMSVNPFGVPLDRFTPKGRAPSENGFRILYVSEYGDHKNLGVVLKALKELAGQGMKDVRLTTTCDPRQFPDSEAVDRKADLDLIRDADIRPLVDFIPDVPYEGIADLYRQADLFVFPTFVESFGHPLVEAMACGVPVIASDIPICRELGGDACDYFNPLDFHDLAARIAAHRKNPDHSKEMASRGAERARSHYDFRNHVRRLMEAVETLRARP